MENKKRAIGGAIVVSITIFMLQTELRYRIFMLGIYLLGCYEALSLGFVAPKTKKNVGKFALLLITLLAFYNSAISLYTKKRIYIFWIVISSWAYDCFAYLCGRNFGKTPISKISKNKTLEGFLGGFICSLILTSAIFGRFFYDKSLLILLTEISIFFAHLGDIFCSYFKRLANAKDFGTIIPGHGGVLDRFDSMLLNTILIYAFVFFSNRSISLL